MIKDYARLPFVYLDRFYRQQIVKASGSAFCWLFNFRAYIRGIDIRFLYDGGSKYKAVSKEYKRTFFEKKQNLFSFSNGISKRAMSLGDEYMLDEISFSDGDVVVDCGANIGDFKLYFDELCIDVEYFGIEPSPREFECLSENVSPSIVFHCGLWDDNKTWLNMDSGGLCNQELHKRM